MPYPSMAGGRRWLTPALAAIVVIFLAYSLPPYFTGDPGLSRVPLNFDLHYPLLVGHVMVSSVAMVTAVGQIWPGLRRRHPVLHRRVGRIYVCTAIPAALSALVIGVASPFGPFVAASNVVLGSLWLWFTINGYLAARQRRFAEHRRHMVRSATLTLSIISNRLWAPLFAISLQPLQHTVFGGDEELFGWVIGGLTSWLGWTIPLLAVHWWLHRKPSTIPQLSAASSG